MIKRIQMGTEICKVNTETVEMRLRRIIDYYGDAADDKRAAFRAELAVHSFVVLKLDEQELVELAEEANRIIRMVENAEAMDIVVDC